MESTDYIYVVFRWSALLFRGVWHSAKSYPRCWQLDPTEGPSRLRCKLRRCHLNVESRFLMPEQQWKLG